MSQSATSLLRARHRHALWMRSVWIGVAVLATELLLARFGAEARVRWGGLGLGAALALLARFWPRRTLRDTARTLDLRIGARNRLEAVAELDARNDEFATALRAEVDGYLEQQRLPRAHAWFAGLVLLVGMFVANVALLSSGRLPHPASAPASTMATASALPANAAEATPLVIPSMAPPAQLRWITPAAITKATPKEEIPLEARAESSTGLRAIALHVALNGERLPPFAIPEPVGAGVQSIVTSLVLAELETRPYDVVTYYLQAERIRSSDIPATAVWPPIVSPLQLVQIRSQQDEPVGFDGDDAAARVLEHVVQLERDQLHVLQEAFALTHEAGAPNDAGRAERLRALEAQQTAVAQSMATAIPAVEPAGIPGDATDALKQAGQEASKAAANLGRADPAAAATAAARALARLSEAEKSAAAVVQANRARRAAEAAATAPEAKPAAAELPARETTVAGRLENLTLQQKKVAERLVLRTDPAAMFAEQDRVARELATLAAEAALPNEIKPAVKSAAEAATEAARQLNDRDALAAAEPAARAAQTLSEALATLEAASRGQAVEQILAAQQALLRAATELQRTEPKDFGATARDAEQRIAAAQQNLQAAAERQQQRGSAEAARKLEELAKAIAQSGVQPDLKTAAKQAADSTDAQKKQQAASAAEKLLDLAQRSADASGNLEGAQQAGERALEELKRVQASLERRKTGPLRWLAPTSDIMAAPAETVSLEAEATSQAGFSKFALRVSVNGEARPPIALPAGVGAGVHPVKISLELATLKVKPDDIISYILAGEIVRPPAGGSTGVRAPNITLNLGVLDAEMGQTGDMRNEFTPAQLITIRKAEKNTSKSGDGDDNDPVGAQVRRLQAAQREIVEHVFAVEQGRPPRSDPSWRQAVRWIWSAQDRNLEMTDRLRDFLQNEDDPLNEGTVLDLMEASDEMDDAVRALAKPDVTAANPPATRALAVLTQILAKSKDESSTAPGGGSNQKQPTRNEKPDIQPIPQTAEQPRKENRAAPTDADELAELYAKAIGSAQRSEARMLVEVPPPPGPGATAEQQGEYVTLLIQRVSGFVRLTTAARESKRAEVLTTGNPADAPPAYRPAVADYFEALARERPAPPPRAP